MQHELVLDVTLSAKHSVQEGTRELWFQEHHLVNGFTNHLRFMMIMMDVSK